VNPLILFFIPPLIGAFIGYSTNIVAIRMLFRPLREIRIFGIKLPFTPGILPKQRKRLAQSIGAMVERELITPQVLRDRLEKVDINGFTQSFSEFLRREEIKKELEAKGRILLRGVLLKLTSFQRLFITAAQYDLTLDEKIPEIIEDIISNIESLLKEERIKKKLLTAVDGQIENILASVNIKSLVSDRIDSLDIERVERIILDVMSDQFKWIEIFGGVLGFLIGLFQSLFAFSLGNY